MRGSEPTCGWEALRALRALGLEVLPDEAGEKFRLRGLAGLRETDRRDALCWAALHRDAILHWLRRESMPDGERAAEDAAADRAMWPLERRYTAPCQMADVLAAHDLQAVILGDDFIIANAAAIPVRRWGAIMEFTRRNGHLINQWLRAAARRAPEDVAAEGENNDD